jgi:hypothetical protein
MFVFGEFNQSVYMKSSLIVSLFLLLILEGYAQKALLFTNKNTRQEILIKEGDLAKFTYKGYISQKEVKSGMVISVEDSIIEISTPSTSLSAIGSIDTRFIYVKDITGFRKFHKSRPYLMTLSRLTIAVGTIVTFYIIDKKTNLNFGQKFGLSLGAGIVSTAVVRGLFPERVKNKIGDEWSAVVLK